MEGFFQACISLDDEIGVKELILRRYHDPSYIFSMEVLDFLSFLQRAQEKEREEQARQQWVTMLPYMSLKQLEYISFEQYYDRLRGRNIDMRSTEEIIRSIEEAHRKAGKDVKIWL